MKNRIPVSAKSGRVPVVLQVQLFLSFQTMLRADPAAKR